MKKSIKNFLVLASLAAAVGGCASTTDMDDLRYQLRIVNKKIDDMKATTVGEMQKRQAAASGQMDQIEQDLIQLKAQLDESYYLNQKLREQNKELEQSISIVAEEEAVKRQQALEMLAEQEQLKENKINELNAKLQMQEQSVKAIQEARIKDAERRANEAALEAEIARNRSQATQSGKHNSADIVHIRADKKKIKKSVVAPPIDKSNGATTASTGSQVVQANAPSAAMANTSPAGPANSAGEYAKAQNLYKKGNYAEAYAAFEAVATNPSSSSRVDARFMMGESLYQQKEYDKAIMQFQKIISQSPDNTNAPGAMLKQGMAFEKLADKGTAKVIYKKLVKAYPASPQAAEAQEKLDTL
jgi:tol-pal system protein YbgF